MLHGEYQIIPDDDSSAVKNVKRSSRVGALPILLLLGSGFLACSLLVWNSGHIVSREAPVGVIIRESDLPKEMDDVTRGDLPLDATAVAAANTAHQVQFLGYWNGANEDTDVKDTTEMSNVGVTNCVGWAFAQKMLTNTQMGSYEKFTGSTGAAMSKDDVKKAAHCEDAARFSDADYVLVMTPNGRMGHIMVNPDGPGSPLKDPRITGPWGRAKTHFTGVDACIGKIGESQPVVATQCALYTKDNEGKTHTLEYLKDCKNTEADMSSELSLAKHGFQEIHP